MSLGLTKLQKRLCNVLQKGLPVCSRPFGEIAKLLDSEESTVLCQIEHLKAAGVIRRISALINYRALGRVSTLAAAHIRQENLDEVVEAVNSLDGVSHSYLREHYYNLWFTLQAKLPEQIDVALSNLSRRFGIDFRSLPVVHTFKLNVCFDANGNGLMLKGVEDVPKSEIVELSDSQKLILSRLQSGLEPAARPFDFLCGEGLEEKDVLRITQELIDKGVIRRIAAVVDHRKLGFAANVLFACEVGQDRVVEVGKRLAHLPIVSHCYERRTFEDWPYNLFAMMHGRYMGEVKEMISKFVEAEKIGAFELLPTAAELKKQPVKYQQ